MGAWWVWDVLARRHQDGCVSITWTGQDRLSVTLLSVKRRRCRMVASSVEELRASLEREAEELAERRERLEGELAEVERQLAARLNAVQHLALIRPLVSDHLPTATVGAGG